MTWPFPLAQRAFLYQFGILVTNLNPKHSGRRGTVESVSQIIQLHTVVLVSVCRRSVVCNLSNTNCHTAVMHTRPGSCATSTTIRQCPLSYFRHHWFFNGNVYFLQWQSWLSVGARSRLGGEWNSLSWMISTKKYIWLFAKKPNVQACVHKNVT